MSGCASPPPPDSTASGYAPRTTGPPASTTPRCWPSQTIMGYASWKSSTSPDGARRPIATRHSRPRSEPSSTWRAPSACGTSTPGCLEKLPLDVVGEQFAALCERAGPDLTVALEFMPYSGIPDLATAWRIVQGVPNAGIIVDGWHWARAGQQIADLDAVPAEQDRGGAAVRRRGQSRWRRYAAESLGHRLPPGKGCGDTVGLVRGLTTTRRHARRHGGGGDLRRASGPRRRYRRASDCGRGSRGPRVRRDSPDVAQLESPCPLGRQSNKRFQDRDRRLRTQPFTVVRRQLRQFGIPRGQHVLGGHAVEAVDRQREPSVKRPAQGRPPQQSTQPRPQYRSASETFQAGRQTLATFHIKQPPASEFYCCRFRSRRKPTVSSVMFGGPFRAGRAIQRRIRPRALGRRAGEGAGGLDGCWRAAAG